MLNEMIAGVSRMELEQMFSNRDLRRLSQYSRNMTDLSDINDLLPAIARAYFNDKIPSDVSRLFLIAIFLMDLCAFLGGNRHSACSSVNVCGIAEEGC